ncbi:MAG: FAD-dependent oxidoreductase [Candidatus Binatia bacterium]
MSDSTPGRVSPTSRRTFLKALGGAAGMAAVPLPGASAVRAGNDGDFDAIVVGGGFAGVTAARELRHAGLRTLLLEARNRLGGRTFTARLGAEHFDLGGMWIHWTQPHVWAEAMRYGLPLVETPGAMPERVRWWDGSGLREAGVREIMPLVGAALCGRDETPAVPLRTLEGLALADDLMSAFHAPAMQAFPRPFDPFFSDAWRAFDALSVKDRLDAMGLSPARRALLEGVLGPACCARFADAGFVEMLRWWALSGANLQRYSDSVARFKLRDGTVSLIEAMIDDGKPEVLLGTPVTRVEQGDGVVRVTTEPGRTFRAPAVIVALPMNVLARVVFAPALDPAKLAASQERHAGAGVKLYARVRGALPSVAVFAPESEPLSMLLTGEAGKDGGVLIAFGTSATRIDAHSVPAVQAVVQKLLPGLEVTETIAYDWHLDPYSLGTWCILRPGQMTKYLAKLREPEGAVHFAGGDIALGWRGFIDGAIESGTRVAREVVARLAGRAAAVVAPTTASASPPPGVAGPPEPALRQCAVCHPTDASGAHGVGPNLRGVVGREVASAPGYAYSDALRAHQGAWSPQDLDAFLAAPATRVPGTKMAFGGVTDAAERARLIDLLSKLR